jgi:menaquinone-9 beta-reductase
MQTCDALIVGGGPAGSTAARQLGRAGLDVIVMDKAEFPRDKVCAGWITPGVVDLLQLDTEAYASQNVLQPISGFRTGLIETDTVETRYGEIVSYGIRRREFDDWLLRRCGARLRLGEPIESIRRDGSLWVVNEAISTPLLIGAGGHFCPVARMLGAKLGAAEPAVAAKEIEFEMTDAQLRQCRVRADIPELYFAPDLKGYGWCFRKGRHLNIGLGREDSHRLTEHLDAFRAFLARRGRLPESVPTKFHGHAYALYGHAPRRHVDDGVLLIGDAAGLAYPESGEGIRPAIESALLAATTIVEADGDYRQPRLAAYSGRLRARFGPSGNRSILPQRLKAVLAPLLLRNRRFTRHVVLDRWFLRAGQAAI